MLLLSSYIFGLLKKCKTLCAWALEPSRLALLVLYLGTIAIGVEGNIFIVSFPVLMKVFHVSENTIQMTLIINFIGMCLAGLICGPLSDSLGRRKTLLIGATIFVLGSIGCLVATMIPYFLASRFLQGFGSGVILAVGSVVVFDLYPLKEAICISTIFGSLTTLLLAFSPTLGAILSIMYGWKANFILIAILAVFSFLLIYFFLHETLPAEQQKPFSLRRTAKDYRALIKSPLYIGNLTICYCMSWAFIIYEANVAFIFMNYLGISQQLFGIYQSFTILTFVFSSFAVAWCIGRYGLAYSAHIGIVIGIGGIVFLMGIAYWFADSPLLISIAISVIESGVIFCSGLFAARAMKVFPELRGTSIALAGSLRLLMASLAISLSGLAFNGTIVPIAWMILSCACLCAILVWILQKSEPI